MLALVGSKVCSYTVQIIVPGSKRSKAALENTGTVSKSPLRPTVSTDKWCLVVDIIPKYSIDNKCTSGTKDTSLLDFEANF